MYNIQKAVSRLPYAPKLKEIEVTDIQKGLGVFTPLPYKPASFDALKANLKQAGYVLASADITIYGKLSSVGEKWFVTADISGQKFALEGKGVEAILAKTQKDTGVEITGLWTTVGKGVTAYEAVDPKTVTPRAVSAERPIAGYFVRTSFIKTDNGLEPSESKPTAPIRTTSPGLTVFKGGAVTPRIYFVKQHLGDLDVWRQIADVTVSYTPSPRVQLELEVPFSRTSYDDGVVRGSGVGLGNITAWAKYRFFRTVRTYGDQQASVRFGIELPTGKSSFPTVGQVNAPAFVRAQLGPISGGLSPTIDVSYSQAGGRVIFGGNVQGTYRTERDGFRMGHELRFNTDLEYVIAPSRYPKPGGELFLILESSLVTRSKGRINGTVAPGSSSTEYYLAPGLQYAARPQFVVEGSLQVPVFRNAGAQVLRTDYSLLLGIRYLF